MNAKLLQTFIALIPAFWKLLNSKTQIVMMTLGVVAVTAWAILVSWSTVKMGAISAYDERWHQLNAQASAERTAHMNEIKTEMKLLRQNQESLGTGIRDIQKILMSSQR